jgi:hypothetical protein
MKKVLLLLIAALLALLFMCRQRIYLCDPLAKVYKTTTHQSGNSAPLQSKSSAKSRSGKSSLLKSIPPSSHADVESNSNPTVVSDNRYGVVTEHPQASSPDLTQNGAASNVAELQSGVSGAFQSSHSVLNLGNKPSQLLSDLLSEDDRKKGRQSGVQVFVNLSGNVLLERDAEPETYLILLQRWSKSAGTPTSLTCVHWLFCFTDADHATTDPLDWTGNSGKGRGKYDPHLTMTGRSVSFVEDTGATMHIDLR